MLSNSDKTYSSLEAVMQPTRRPDSEKQVVPDDGKQCVVNSEATEAESNRWYVGNQTIRHHQRLRKKWILCIGAFTLIIILAAVLGGLFGSRSNQSPKASPSSLSSSSARATASPAASTTATTQSSPNTSSDTSTQRKIAAFSFPWGINNNTRMYFQDNERQILEAGNPEANSTWGFRALGVSGKNRTVLAAAVSDLAFSDEAFSEVTGAPLDRRIHADILQGISVIYLDEEDHLCDVNYIYPTETWSPGFLSDRGYTALANSSLAILYNQCASCANSTIIAFQDQDGHIQISNLTSSGWTLTQLGTGMDPIMGTGLALEALRGYHEGWPLQINLHYQKSNLSLCQASWIPNNPSSDNAYGWSLNQGVYDTIALGSPIASAASSSNASTGEPSLIEVLYLSTDGIRHDAWSPEMGDWRERNAKSQTMTNSTSDPQSFGDLAVTATGMAFSVVKGEGNADSIESGQLEDDQVSWRSSGDVDIGGAWG